MDAREEARTDGIPVCDESENVEMSWEKFEEPVPSSEAVRRPLLLNVRDPRLSES